MSEVRRRLAREAEDEEDEMTVGEALAKVQKDSHGIFSKMAGDADRRAAQSEESARRETRPEMRKFFETEAAGEREHADLLRQVLGKSGGGLEKAAGPGGSASSGARVSFEDVIVRYDGIEIRDPQQRYDLLSLAQRAPGAFRGHLLTLSTASGLRLEPGDVAVRGE